MARIIHPPTPPPLALWKGASDLTGETGDPLYGTYLRSNNVFVKNATTVAKRRGYFRSIDERFVGHARSAYRRDGSGRYLVVVDGAGVKVLDASPPSLNTGVTAGHPGFVNDNFERTGPGLSATGKPWLEGQDSDELPGRTVGDNTSIVSGAVQFNSATATTGAIDWETEAVTPFSHCLLELDLTNISLPASGDFAEFYMFTGLPDAYADPANNTLFRERMFAVDAVGTWNGTFPGGQSVDTVWTGCAGLMRITNVGGSLPYQMRFDFGEFQSDKKQSAFDEKRNGRLETVGQRSHNFTALSIKTDWLLRMGRNLVGNGEWQTTFYLWKDRNIGNWINGNVTDIGGTNPPFFAHINNNRYIDRNRDGWFFVLPDKGGFQGFYSSFRSATMGRLDVGKIKTSLTPYPE